MTNSGLDNTSRDIGRFGFFSLLLRIVAAGLALYFLFGVAAIWFRLLALHPYQTRDNALIFPWLLAPLAPCAGAAAAYALWGLSRPDRIGGVAYGAMAVWAGLNVHSIVVDLATNPQPSDHAAGAGIFTAGLLWMVVIVPVRNVQAQPHGLWRQLRGIVLGLIFSLVSVVGACISFSGWATIYREGLVGWAVFTTPVIAVVSAVIAARIARRGLARMARYGVNGLEFGSLHWTHLDSQSG